VLWIPERRELSGVVVNLEDPALVQMALRRP
jgi:hypothetical protein